MHSDIKKAREIIDTSDALLISAGAGMGVDSGLPDFRGNEGFWRAYPVVKELGLSFEEMANPHWFEQDSALAWAFYGHRYNLYKETTPHRGFEILRDLGEQKGSFFLFTSNVDGQFQKAGFGEDSIYEVHGSIHHFQCTKNCGACIWRSQKDRIKVDMDRFRALEIPKCTHCGSVARPNILMFGDWLWDSARAQEQEERYRTWLSQNRDRSVAIIEIGAGSAVPTVRMNSERIAQALPNAKLIRINPREPELNGVEGVSLAMGALEALEGIVNQR